MGWARTLPTAFGALVWGLCAAMLVGNLLIAPFAYDYQFHLWSYPAFGELIGVVLPGKRRATLHTVLDGSFQAAYATQLGSRLPVFTGAVRLRNQVEYSAFAFSGTPDVIVGQHDELIEHDYVKDYCSRDLARFLPGARRWAAEIREMQDAVERQGKAFLYLLTPSKVAQYPEFLPPGLSCPSTAASRTGLVPAWMALVRQAGVHVVDTTAVLWGLHGDYPFPLFPPGGTHWNGIGAAQAGQAVAAELDRQRPGAGFGTLPFNWHMQAHPAGVDIDLARLMNLFWLPADHPVPVVEFGAGPPPPACPVHSIVMVGGSFGHAANEYLSREPCEPTVTEFEYWHVDRLEWFDGVYAHLPVDEADRARVFASADVVMYEENEEQLGHAGHGPALYQFLLGRPA